MNLKEIHNKIESKRWNIANDFPLYFDLFHSCYLVKAQDMYDCHPSKIKIFDISILEPFYVSVEDPMKIKLIGYEKISDKRYARRMYDLHLGKTRCSALMYYATDFTVFPIIGHYKLDEMYTYCSYPCPYMLYKLAKKDRELTIKKLQDLMIPTYNIDLKFVIDYVLKQGDNLQ